MLEIIARPSAQLGVANVVGHAVARGLPRIVYVSSASIFFQPGSGPIHLDMEIQPGTTAYAKSKAQAEQVIDPVARFLDVAEEHRAVRLQAGAVNRRRHQKHRPRPAPVDDAHREGHRGMVEQQTDRQIDDGAGAGEGSRGSSFAPAAGGVFGARDS